VLVDSELAPLLRDAMGLMQGPQPLVVEYTDPTAEATRTGMGADYQEFIAGGDPEFAWQMPDDEWDAISLNYTSGTTGNPKGVVYHHLQRLVLPVVGLGRLGHPCVPAPGAGRGDVPGYRRAQGQPVVRRADRDVGAA
jgi:hypothetical protein